MQILTLCATIDFVLIGNYYYYGYSKSSPDIYLLATKRLRLSPENCTVYEDIITGTTSTRGAGFRTVAIADKTNAHDKDRLIWYSDRYITGWSELLSNI